MDTRAIICDLAEAVIDQVAGAGLTIDPRFAHVVLAARNGQHEAAFKAAHEAYHDAGWAAGTSLDRRAAAIHSAAFVVLMATVSGHGGWTNWGAFLLDQMRLDCALVEARRAACEAIRYLAR